MNVVGSEVCLFLRDAVDSEPNNDVWEGIVWEGIVGNQVGESLLGEQQNRGEISAQLSVRH